MDRIINVSVGGNHLKKDSKNAGVRGEANVTRLRITFDEGWDGYAKKVVFFDAYGSNPVERLLTADFIENIVKNTRVYLVPIPAEPMAEAGKMTFVIEGVIDNKVQKSFSDRLEVKDSPRTEEALQPVEPTPSEVDQLQASLESILGGIKEAVQAKEDIENMTVTAETLKTGEASFVRKTEVNDVVNLHFGLPAGGKGETGDTGVYVGSTEPTDEKISVWVDPDGEPDEIAGFGSLMTNIKEFGAVGDGVADDTAALKAAARCGEAVYFPAGTYLLCSQIDMSADINWIGEGEKSIIKLMPCDQSRPEQYGGRTVYNCYMINHKDPDSNNGNKYSLSLQGLVLDANKQGYANDVHNNGSSINDHTTCLDLHKPSKVYLNNVEVKNGLIEGCYIWANETIVDISNCKFLNNGEYQVDASGIHIEGENANTFISNCEFSYNGFFGMLLSGVTGANVSNVMCCNNGYGGISLRCGSSNNALSGIYCHSNGYGIALQGGYGVDIADENSAFYASSNAITGLTTKGNSYGVIFGNSKNTCIGGWCSNDDYAYYIGYGNSVTNDITGIVVGAFDYSIAECKHDLANIDKFKVNFIGR